MRPRRERLGWIADRRAARRRSRRFNEAEARAPRMAGVAVRRSVDDRMRFNEAEARAPRMATRPRRALGDAASASMRPRRERLGWRCDGDQPTPVPEAASMRPRRERLGWRRHAELIASSIERFNEAEARAPRMALAVIEHPRDAIAASMRPRRERLGWRVSASKLPARRSRCFNEAEARAPRMAGAIGIAPSPAIALQ